MPGQSPLFHAMHAERYGRQELIRYYQQQFSARLVVMVDQIAPEGVTIFEELLYDADPSQDLHLMLVSPGGDGETAIRLVRAAQDRCRELTVVVPEQAKSAATLLTLGAHHIVMGPTSDLGPIDPQLMIQTPNGMKMVAAKDLIAAYNRALDTLKVNPGAWPLLAGMFAETDATMLEFAFSAIDRTGQMMEEALSSHPGRTPEEVKDLALKLKLPLIEERASHGALFGGADALAAGLPVAVADPTSPQWRIVWHLWAKYFLLRNKGQTVYEGARVSHTFSPPPSG